MRLFLLGLSMVILCQTASAQSMQLTNEKIWYSSEFLSSGIYGLNSMKDGLHYTSLEAGEDGRNHINKYSYKSGKSTGIVVRSSDIFGKSMKDISGYAFSEDEKQLLIETNPNSIYRHSYEADYYIYNLESGESKPIHDFNEGQIRLAEFSPNGNHIAFVRENNLYCYDVKSGETTQITYDGKYNKIINGYPDWVYEEEFGFNKGFYWSPNSDRIAFYRFDESRVKQFDMYFYEDSEYPDPYSFKYPKAGELNSRVTIHIYDLNQKWTKDVSTGADENIYIPRIKWSTDNDKLCVMKLNRHQNNLQFLLTDLSQKSKGAINPNVVYEERSKTYIDISDDLHFMADGESFIWSSEKSGFRHIYLCYFDQGKKMRPITAGDYDVNALLGVDENRGVIYYAASTKSPLGQEIFRKGITSREFEEMSTQGGSNSASFSSSFEYYILTHSDANTPADITLYDNKGKMIRILEDNARLKENLASYNLSPKEFFTFNNDQGDELNCWMIKPPNFDSRRQYPVLVTIYGGPGSGTVRDSWGGMNYMWHQLLAQKGYIVVSCDPRGTGRRGVDFKHSTYLQLGKLETEDFIDFAEYLSNQAYIDGNRIGIQGWSYGGYMSSLCMTKGADHYKAGIAVAPVTNWKWYDTIYTERYMRTPAENKDGYEDNSPTNHVDKLEGAYLVVHGSGDDNVHMQNTMEMVGALVNANKDFDMFIYPNKNHGIYGGPTRMNLFNKMTDFLVENL